ncbi:hypothetical protein H4W19_02760 [Pseudoxanthomonas mexicana]|uniref:Type II toxin-antitoxin system VapC family toxin n=1 Tax=Pseudoxanthomonas mexicana TaxID=128785 RepID=A0ABX6RBU4_PSEMX|nr:hypothetical protein [Pseudoxanthomonas mexicana]QLQ29436.1 MAG: hypothetical protein HZT39_15410 [Pseudoxanthomonas sp.]QND80740.1 hypothetical protein H4W19_02760 [Pseudoxanthomonas mexicana]
MNNNDIVMDTNVARLYDHAADPRYKKLFQWIHSVGSLAVSMPLLREYSGTTNHVLAGLVRHLTDSGRLNKFTNRQIDDFNDDRHYNYTSNGQDRAHARLCFLSNRKIFIGFDNRLIDDINGFRSVNGVKPFASRYPDDRTFVDGEGDAWDGV